MLVLEQYAQRTLRQGRSFAGLMELFELNFLQLQSLVPVQDPARVAFCSSVGDGLDLHGHILERHRYTTELRLTYVFGSGDQREPDPDARIRIYHDARVAEVTACNPGARIARLCGLQAADGYTLERNWIRNCFLNKWLEYLNTCGHSPATVKWLDACSMESVHGQNRAARLLDTPEGLA